MEGKLTLYGRFTARMRLLAISTGIIIALVPPTTYFALNWGDQKISADAMSREISRKLRDTVKTNPELWKFSVVKFLRIFDEVENKEISEIRIYDSGGTLLADTSFALRPVLRRTGRSDIVFNNLTFGRVELVKTADSTLLGTVLLFLGFSLLGGIMAFVLYHYPAAIVRKAEDSVNLTIASLNREVLERSLTEREVVRSLHEKEILLKEIHHRVKNNLQIIISLINLQLYGSEKNEAAGMLRSFQHRVNTMAVVHEHLYNSPTLSLIDMDEYLKALVQGYMDSFQEERPALRCQVDVEELTLTLDLAMPIGLIVCELVTNSLKYAFEGRASGLVKVSLRKSAGEMLRLCVSDDGIGADAKKTEGDRSGLGFQLVEALTTQIRGKLTKESSGGFRVTIDGIRP